ncbi:hypothetical protein CONLIGDRAFT_701412 [Coniochaeta ligniaria NRRL 30616]|uniref:Uncharacterized protein n=1 Tax=Coniochaeta ligniaria NRRL 30616 TaxID=1408157 RepID=A0A1J7IQ76_9PEZI|nr:hypothetical protein CONLIGDRAFT_701412 [Coniochaeta ligniaria NRRL 30616]
MESEYQSAPNSYEKVAPAIQRALGVPTRYLIVISYTHQPSYWASICPTKRPLINTMSQGRGIESRNWRARQGSDHTRRPGHLGLNVRPGRGRGSSRRGGSLRRGGWGARGTGAGGLGAERAPGEGISDTSRASAQQHSSSDSTDGLGDTTMADYNPYGPGPGGQTRRQAANANDSNPGGQTRRQAENVNDSNPGGQTRRQAENLDDSNPALKKRKLLPPVVTIHGKFWIPDNSAPVNETRRFMVMTEHGFPKQIYDQGPGPFRQHVESILGEALTERAVIDLPKVGVYSESGENAQDRFFGNQFAGEALKRVRDDFDLLESDNKAQKEQIIKDKDRVRELGLEEGPEMSSDLPHLDIPARHRMILMAKNLHTRYRTMWQMATNAALIPATSESYKNQPRDFSINLQSYGGFKPHKDRYDLCTALAHSGSLRDDLILGKSRYFQVWQSDDHTLQGPSPRQRLYEKMFQELYSMDYETADWIVNAADVEDVKPAQELIRLIDRFRYAMDVSYKHAHHGHKDSATGKTNQSMSRNTLNNYKSAETLYKNWAKGLKQLVADQQKKPSDQLYSLNASEKHKISHTTDQFYARVRPLLAGNWDRLERLKAWKPTEALQRQYNSFQGKHDPFAA